MLIKKLSIPFESWCSYTTWLDGSTPASIDLTSYNLIFSSKARICQSPLQLHLIRNELSPSVHLQGGPVSRLADGKLHSCQFGVKLYNSGTQRVGWMEICQIGLLKSPWMLYVLVTSIEYVVCSSRLLQAHTIHNTHPITQVQCREPIS